MGYCLTVLFRIYGPKLFIQEFLAQFTWRGSFNVLLLRGRGIIPGGEDFTEDYHTFATHYKYYYDVAQNKGTLSAKQEVLKQFTDDSLVQNILDFSETYSGEICYVFKIWKDNWSGQSNDDEFGVSANLRLIYQRVLKSCRGQIPRLKWNQNFKLSFTIIERSDRIYANIVPKILFDYLNGDDMFKFAFFDRIDSQSMRSMDDKMTLPPWKTAYPEIKRCDITGYTKRFDDGVTQFSNEKWTDYTPEMREKLDRQNDLQFRKNRRVQLINLKKKEWNGLKAVIFAEYEFKVERWPVLIEEPNKKVLIKAANLKLIR